MSDTYEIIFEQVAADDLQELLNFIEMDSQARSGLAVSESLGRIDSTGVDKRLIDKIVAYDGVVCLMERLHEFKVSESICVPLVLLRALKYEDGVDVELSFNSILSVDIDCIMFAMQRYANAISKKFHVKEFYGGLEPAVDIDTRYFTGNALGPLGAVSKPKCNTVSTGVRPV